MKLNKRYGVLMAALLAMGVGTALAASSSTAPVAAGPHGRFHGHGPGALVGTLLRATRQLNLTAEQQSQIKTILSNARAQWKANLSAPADITVLGNPADPNYATAVQAAKTNVANRVQLESEVEGQVYNVLTTEQKAQLPAVLASMKAQMAQRRAAWQQRTGAAAGTAGASN
jgi:Spy/CpxP family protein refolding chaperone